MADFVVGGIIWTLALYGLIEIVKNIIYYITYKNLSPNGIYIIVAVKNGENQVEGFLRTILFRILYGKEEVINKVLVADLNSNDESVEIIKKVEKDYDFIKLVDWKECKDIIDNIV